jgi:hypothetical protein
MAAEVHRCRGGAVVVASLAVVAVASAAALSLGGRRSGGSRAAGGLLAGGAGEATASSRSAVTTVGSSGHDVAGALRAATSMVAMEPALVAADDATAAQLVAGWAASTSTASLMALFRRERTGFLDAPGGPYSFEVAPVAAKASPAGPDQVTVQLWCAEVVLAKGQPSYATYVTQSLQLVWEAGSWRLMSAADSPGPDVGLAPGRGPTPPGEASNRLAGFAAVGPLESKGS